MDHAAEADRLTQDHPRARAAADPGPDCPRHPGNSGLRRGCRECVAEDAGGFTPRPRRTSWMQRLRLLWPCHGCAARDIKLEELRVQLRAAWAAPPPPADDGAAAIVRALAAVPGSHLLGQCSTCCLCASTILGDGTTEHAADCAYRRARAWVEAHDGPGTVAR